MEIRRRRRYRVVCSIAAAIIAVCGMASTVPAQTDPCSKIDEELIKRGTSALSNEEKEAAKKSDDAGRPAKEKARDFALNDLAGKPSTLRGSMAQRIASPGSALATFDDKRIESLPDASKVCVQAYARRDGAVEWQPVSLRQVFLSEKTNDKPKRLNVIFNVDDLPGKGSEATYLFIGALTDGPPALSFSHAERVTVTSKLCALLAALAFVGAFYLALVIITYTDETNSLEGPAWLAYTLSPVRISASWFGEASMSQVQLLLFTFIVAGLLFYHWWISYVLSDLSTNLLMLIGISAVGTAASKFAQTVKTALNDQTARYLIAKGWYGWDPIPARSHATLGKLLLTDGRLDIYKFQMAIFTVVVACYVISVGQQSLVDVKISETMLYLIGISQGVYVGGKAVTDRTTDLEASVQKMIDLENKIRDAAGKSPAPPELPDWYSQYANAARMAAIEFTSLQNRYFPTQYDATQRKLRAMDSAIAQIQAKKKAGQALTADEQKLETEYNMTAKELAAFEEPQREQAPQRIENIDPAVLKP